MSDRYTATDRTRVGNYSARERQYKVAGFWSDRTVEVGQSALFDPDGRWERPRIGWSMGGMEAGTDPILAAENFAHAVLDAVRVAREWDTDTGKPCVLPPEDAARAASSLTTR